MLIGLGAVMGLEPKNSKYSKIGLGGCGQSGQSGLIMHYVLQNVYTYFIRYGLTKVE